MALAPAPDIIKVLHGYAPSAYFFAREGYIPFRPAMAGKRKSLRMTGKARAGNRREAPGGAEGRGLRQRDTWQSTSSGNATHGRTEAVIWRSCAI